MQKAKENSIVNIAILLSGSGSNMEVILKNTLHGVLKDVCQVKAVISNNKETRGLKIASSNGIPTFFVNAKNKSRQLFEEEIIQLLQPFNIDYIILAGFMRILSPHLVNAYPNRIINIHPADTAKYQGACGYEWAFKNKLSETMITIHYVDEGLDTGPAIAKQKVDLRGTSTLNEVKHKGLKVEHLLYSNVLKEIFNAKQSH